MLLHQPSNLQFIILKIKIEYSKRKVNYNILSVRVFEPLKIQEEADTCRQRI